MQAEILVDIKSVGEVLDNANLHIPDYQRPYKWERRHIRNLFYDVYEAVENDIPEYRIGSIILHENGDFFDIVDGQQRLISLSLLFYYFLNYDKNNLFLGSKGLIDQKKYIAISRKHAKENLNEWEILCNSIEKDKLQKVKTFIVNNCRFSVIRMPYKKLAEAFQLFDSQNNRGKALKPYEILKAYHLRSIENPTESIIKNWENFDKKKGFNLEVLFDKHLFRVRSWANGETGLYRKKHGSELRFSERFVDDFKGVSLKNGDYPYLKLYKELETLKIEFPLSICMPIINGENFFRYVEYCYGLFSKIKSEPGTKPIGTEMLNAPIFTRNWNLYENMIALYFDRFGHGEYDDEMKGKVFVWAFYPRIVSERVYDSTIANYSGIGVLRGKDYQKLFQKLSISATPREFIAGINMDLLGNHTQKTILKALKKKKAEHEKPVENS